MTLTDILMIAATALSPFIAVQVTKWLEASKEARDRRLHVFRTLMATRAANVSTAHVQALNSIDFTFDGSQPLDKQVTTAWKEYLDQLNKQGPVDAAWIERRDDRFAALMIIMGKALGFDFDSVHIKKAGYMPNAHVDLESDQHNIRKAVLALLQGQAALPIKQVSASDRLPTGHTAPAGELSSAAKPKQLSE